MEEKPELLYDWWACPHCGASQDHIEQREDGDKMNLLDLPLWVLGVFAVTVIAWLAWRVWHYEDEYE